MDEISKGLNTKAMKKIVFIVDALKNIDNWKRYKMASKKIIKPPFSFEPDAAYLCGKAPEDTDSGTLFWFDPENSRFKDIKKVSNFLPNNPLLIKKIFKKIVVRYLNQKGTLIKKDIGLIPFDFLPFFDFSEEHNLFDPTVSYKFKTIFNKLGENNYYYIGVPISSGKLHEIKKTINKEILKKFDIFFIYIGDLDYIGHRFGGSSQKYQEKIDEIFKYIINFEKFYGYTEQRFKKIVFGDHGMVDIQRTFNIQKILKNLRLKEKIDYLYFLDSTLARFWFFNERAKKIILEAIPNNEFGSWISNEEKNIYKINYRHNKFGDAIWWANGGTLIVPNFWQRKVLKGMHGYRNDEINNYTMIIGDFKYKNGTEYITMMDVHSILIDFLSIG